MAAEGEVGVRLMPYVLTPVLGIMAEQNFKFRAVRLQRRTTVNALSQSFVARHRAKWLFSSILQPISRCNDRTNCSLAASAFFDGQWP